MEFQKDKNNESNHELAQKYDELTKKLDEISVEYVPYAIEGPTEGITEILFDTDSGQRVIFKKSNPERQVPEDYFIQDWCISVFPGSDVEAQDAFQQIDYNFNEKGDALLRKRVLSSHGKEMPLVPEISRDMDKAEIATAAFRALFNATEASKNLELEEKMGLNNQPVTISELDELLDIVDGAHVLRKNDSVFMGYERVDAEG